MLKLKHLLIVLMVLIGLSARAVDFEYTYEGSTLKYRSNSETGCEVTGYASVAAGLIIPASVTNEGVEYKVISIGADAFKDCSGMTSLFVASDITSVGNGAFDGCDGLVKVFYPVDDDTQSSPLREIFEFRTHIGYPKEECQNIIIEDGIVYGRGKSHIMFAPASMKGEYTIPNSVTSIGIVAFAHCSGLTSVTIPNSVTSIGDAAFGGCSGLTSVTIPNSVTSIGNGGFMDCSGLTSVTIPNSVTTIGWGAFMRCSGLISVTISNSVTSIEQSAFEGCSGLTSVTIPNSVTSIGVKAFSGCSGLTSVSIPNSVTSIERYTFEGCSGLTMITIPNSVTSIGHRAFDKCGSLTKFIIEDGDDPIEVDPYNVTNSLKSFYIGRNLTSQGKGVRIAAVFGTGLTSVILGEKVTELADLAFKNCSGLTMITIPNSVTSIGKEAFGGTSLRSIVVPASVNKIGDRAFGDQIELITINAVEPPVLTSACMGYTSDEELERILVMCANKSSANKYRDNDQWGEFFIAGKNEYKGTVHMSGTGRPLSEEIVGQIQTMPGNITNLKITGKLTDNDWVLLNRNLVRCYDLDLSELDCTSVPAEAFKDMRRLQFVTLPSKAKSLGAGAFGGCNSLVQVKFGENLTEIGDNAFRGLSYLRFMELPSSLERIGNNSFEGTNCIQTYTAPSTLTFIGEGAFRSCSTLRSIDLSASQLSQISYSSFQYCGHLREVILPESLQSIGEWAFQSTPINTIVIPEKVESIGSSAFAGTNLLAVNLPSNLKEVSQGAFGGCSLMNSVSFGRGITTLGESAFAGDSQIKNISIVADVPPTAPTSAFEGISKRKCNVAIPTTKFWDYLNAPVWGGFSQLNNDLSVETEISENAEVAVSEESIAQEVESVVSEEEAKAEAEESQDIATNEAIANQNNIEVPEQVRRRAPGSGSISLAGAFMKIADGQKFTVSDSNQGYRFHIAPKNGAEITSVTLDGKELKDQISADGYLKVGKIENIGRLVVKTVGGASGEKEVVVNRPADDKIYDLMGRVVENPGPGIYIKNGKKFLVK